MSTLYDFMATLYDFMEKTEHYPRIVIKYTPP